MIPSIVLRSLRNSADQLTSPFRRARPKCLPATQRLLKGKSGIEFGGPSALFARNGLFPLYTIVGGLDNCNFANRTLWEGDVREGRTFVYDRLWKTGHQYLLEATAADRLPEGVYDLLLSSHMIEHTANPLLAAAHWVRLLKEGGILVLVVPHKEGTFDHRRPVTAFDHLLEDYRKGTGEDDATHVEEILAYHDLARDPAAGNFDEFKKRSALNAENRCLHHHVFDTELAVKVVDWAKLDLIDVEPVVPYHIFLVARKPKAPGQRQNAEFLRNLVTRLRTSPFAADREKGSAAEETHHASPA